MYLITNHPFLFSSKSTGGGLSYKGKGKKSIRRIRHFTWNWNANQQANQVLGCKAILGLKLVTFYYMMDQGQDQCPLNIYVIWYICKLSREKGCSIRTWNILDMRDKYPQVGGLRLAES